jgi:hypothetical protein
VAWLALAATSSAQTAAPYTLATRIDLRNYAQDYPWAAQDTRLVSAGDLNADGVPDLAMTTPGRWYTYVVGPNGTFAFGTYPQGGTSIGIAAGEFNGDGRSDLAIGIENTVLINFGNGSGGFDGGPQVPVGSIGPYSRITDIAAADFDRDGRTDLAVVDTDPLNDVRTSTVNGALVYHRNSIALLRGAANGQFVPDPQRSRLVVPAFPLRTRSDDFNGDGRPELVTENNNSVLVHYNQAAGGFAANTYSAFPGGLAPQVDVIATATTDFDGDGRRDLAALHSYPTATTTGGFYRVQLFRNVPHASLPFVLSPQSQEIELAHPAGSLAVADFNGDGRQDLIVGLETGGAATLALYAGRGDFTFDAPIYYNGGFDAGAIAVGDFSGDGKPDIAVVDCSHGAFVMLRHD